MKNLKIVNILVLGVALFVAFNIYKKQLADVDQLKVQKESEIKKVKVLKELSAFNSKAASYGKVLSQKEPDSVMSGISEIARASGVNIESLRPGEQAYTDDYSVTSFTLSFNAANYDTLGKFISRLENDGEMFLVVDSLKVNRSSSAGAGASLSANLKISTYSLNEE